MFEFVGGITMTDDPNQDCANLRKAAEEVVKAYETPPLKTPFLKPAIDRLRAALKGE